VRRHLAAERAAGETFEIAWPRALGTIPPRTYERAEWVAALRWAEAEFRATYNGRDAERGAVREELLVAA